MKETYFIDDNDLVYVNNIIFDMEENGQIEDFEQRVLQHNGANYIIRFNTKGSQLEFENKAKKYLQQ